MLSPFIVFNIALSLHRKSLLHHDTHSVLLCLVPHLIGAHPLAVELVGDALDGDLHFCYFGVVKDLGVASEGLLRGNILGEHQDSLHAAGGHV